MVGRNMHRKEKLKEEKKKVNLRANFYNYKIK